MLVLNTMILILTAIHTIILSQNNMQLSFHYHIGIDIGIGVECNDIDFDCNTKDITFIICNEVSNTILVLVMITMILFLLLYKRYHFRKAICNLVSNTILVFVLNAMILILTAIQTILLSQCNIQSIFQYHIGKYMFYIFMCRLIEADRLCRDNLVENKLWSTVACVSILRLRLRR